MLATLAILAVVVFVALNYGNYNSLLPADLFSPKVASETVVETVASEPAVEQEAADADVDTTADAEVEEVIEESVE